jgi:hypothetical protein
MSKSESRAERKMIGSVAAQRAQLAAQLEAAVGSSPRPMSITARSGQPRAEGRQRVRPVGVGATS